jgi:SAM-dependent methyltransferase
MQPLILAPMLEVTGERLLPEQQRGELVHAQHLARYRFAAQFAQGRRVLDAACGEGYGTAMLAGAGAREAVGIDIDESTVDHARTRYGLRFERADVAELPFEDGSFELVVSFETLEHVPDAAQAIGEFRRVLSDDGLLIASTPNSDRYLVDNEFHTREFTEDEFRALLAPHFPEVAFFYQQDWLTSAVLGAEQLGLDDGERRLALELTKVARHEPGDQLFTIAVAGPTPGSVSETAVVTAIFEAQKLHEWVKRALGAEKLYWKVRRELEDWMERSYEAERQLTQAREKVARMENSLSWKVTRPLRGFMSWARRGRGRS